MFWIIVMCFVVLIALSIVIYMLPADQAVKTKKKKKKEEKPTLVPDSVFTDTKDWKSIAERWEKQNQSLSGEIEKMKMDQRKVQQETDQHKTEAKDLLEKLALEKSWREKEQATIEKFKVHEKDLKGQIIRTESDLEKEHSNRLRLERELQEVKIKHEQLLEEKRELSIQARSQQTTLDSQTKEIRELKSDNAGLKEKRESHQWVAKSEFDELKKELDHLKKSHG